jgi:hypothetical protein
LLLIVGVREDDFVADIPYPKHLIPKKQLPVATSLPRPKSPIDSTLGSSVETSTDSETPSPSLEKPTVIKKRSNYEKCHVGKFLWNNKLAIASGAAVMGGGLWLWDKWTRMKAGRKAELEEKEAEVSQHQKPEMTRPQELMAKVPTVDYGCCDCREKHGAVKIDMSKINETETSPANEEKEKQQGKFVPIGAGSGDEHLGRRPIGC